MERRFRLFVILASVSVVLIIGLQLYWLNNMYLEQKARFRADVENTMTEAMIGVQMNMVMGKGKSADLFKKIRNGINNALQKHNSANTGVVIKYAADSAGDSLLNEMNRADANIVLDFRNSAKSLDTSGFFAAYNESFKTGLAKRNISAVYQMALIRLDGTVIKATTDKKQFKALADKQGYTNTFEAPLGRDGTMLQVAFEDINSFVLRNMAWVIAISILFISLFVYSFVYLLATFFRQKRMAEIRNDFINNMTHELKTPVSAVSVALELIGSAHTTGSAKEEYLEAAQSELKRLGVLIEKVLNMAAFEKNEIKLHRQDMPVKQLLDEINITVKPALERNNARLYIEVVPDSLYASIDHVHIGNVLQNLVDNALKYNDKAQPEIYILASAEGADLKLEVRDNGKGIEQAHLPKIFDQFFRVPSGDLHEVKGYGLGLSYVKAVVELHGGSIDVESVPKEGTHFIIRIPRS